MEQLALNAPLRSLARELGEQGMARTLEAEREAWIVDAIAALRRFAAGRLSFRMEEFRAWYAGEGGSPHDAHVWGAITLMACRTGVIEWTDRYVPSTSPRTHGHPVKEWRAVHRG